MIRFSLPLLAAMLVLFSLSLTLASAADAAQIAGDFTIEWRQMIAADERPALAMTIGGTEIALRPLPKEKEKDTPRSALFVGESNRSKTLIFPGKWYHFTLVGHDGKTQLFINGYPDAPPADLKLAGDVKTAVTDVKVAPNASSPQEVLARFKSKLPARDIVTVGHSGVQKYATENTRISYVMAVEAGAPIVEIDTALTSDGQIILMHDKTVDRTTNGKGKVAELTLEQIRKLDAGSWFDLKYKGEPVPTIDEIDQVVRGKAAIMFDLKAEGQGKAIAEWLGRSKFPRDQVILAPWEDAEGVAVRQYVKDVPMIRLTSKLPTASFDDAYFAKMKQMGFSGFSINWQNLTDDFVRAAQKNGMKIYVWTINDAPDISGAALLGVDGVVTDDSANTRKQLLQLTTAAAKQ
jgi:glycerophosphoryl diester phosphodiesterase